MHHRVGQTDPMTLFLCGDVMIGRGIDQVLSHPSDPHLYESYMHTARGYSVISMILCKDLNGDKPIPLGDQVHALVDRPKLRVLAFEILLCHPTGLATDNSNIDRHASTYQFWVQFTYWSQPQSMGVLDDGVFN